MRNKNGNLIVKFQLFKNRFLNVTGMWVTVGNLCFPAKKNQSENTEYQHDK